MTSVDQRLSHGIPETLSVPGELSNPLPPGDGRCKRISTNGQNGTLIGCGDCGFEGVGGGRDGSDTRGLARRFGGVEDENAVSHGVYP